MDDHRKALADHFTTNGLTVTTEAKVKEFIKEIKAAAKRCRKAAGDVVVWPWSTWGLSEDAHDRKMIARRQGLQRWAEAKADEPLGHLLDSVGFNYDNDSISLTYDLMSYILREQGVVIAEDPDRLARLAATRKQARIRHLRKNISVLKNQLRYLEEDILRYETELEKLTDDVQVSAE